MREQQPLQGCCASKAMSRPGAPLPSLTLATAFISGEPEDQPANVPCAMGGGRRIAGRARASAHIAPQEERCFGTRKRSPWARLPAVDSRGPAAVATSSDEQTVNRLQSPDCPQEAGNPIPYRSDTVTEPRAPLWKPRQENALTVPFSYTQGIFRIGWPGAIPAAAENHPLSGAFCGPRFAASMQRWAPRCSKRLTAVSVLTQVSARSKQSVSEVTQAHPKPGAGTTIRAAIHKESR